MAGYEYQIDVSVWLALDLILANRLTHELVLEPESQEDLEGVLEEHEPGRVTSKLAIENYQLIVQAKRRTGDAWTVAGVKALLEHGTARPSAVKRLADPSARYLLVTSAALNGGSAGMRVGRAGAWPSATAMPKSIAQKLPAGAPGRVAIIGNQDEERLRSKIKELLTESFRVPHARWDECRRALREEARVRIMPGASGHWGRTDLERVIRNHDGYIASSAELEHYVHPTNWAHLRSAMNSRHAALIIGQSGTGKTLAAKKLYEELRLDIPGLARIQITLGPQQLRDDTTPPPVLYEVEDPWGRYDFDPRSRPWNDQMAQIFAHATHDRMVVATSRLDVAETSGALRDVKPWMIALESEHYGGRERVRLYRARIGDLPHNLRGVALQAEADVLAELATPLEIQKFFDALRTLDATGLSNPSHFLREAIRRAHQASIERTVIEQIEARSDVPAATVIWGLLKANDKLSLPLMLRIEEALSDLEPSLQNGVLPLISFFVAARNLRQIEMSVGYYHPRVESGIEQTLGRHRLVARRILSSLTDVLVSLDGPTDFWGTSAAVRMISAAVRLPELKPAASPTAQRAMDAWLGKELASGGNNFSATLKLAAAAGSTQNNASEAARFLLNRRDQSLMGMQEWRPPDRSEDWYARMRADPAVKVVVDSFIRDVLPDERDNFGSIFFAEAERLAGDLTDAFLYAAETSVRYGMAYTSDAIAAGALKDLEKFEAIVDSAIAVLTPSERERLEMENTRLAVINGEYSEGYGEYLADDDSGYTAREFLEAYVDRSRKERGWRHIARHRHLDRLLGYWLRALAKETFPPADEVAGAFDAGFGSSSEDDLWHMLMHHWDRRYLPHLVQRVAEKHTEHDIRMAALACLVQRAPSQLTTLGQTLTAQGNLRRLLEIALELGHLRHRHSGFDGEERVHAVKAASETLPPAYAEISEAAFLLNAGKTPSLSSEALRLIEDTDSGSEDIGAFRVQIDRYVPLSVTEDVHRLLANAVDADVATEAIDAAIRHGMSADIEAALNHRFADVVARALTAIATPLPAPLPEHVLSFVTAKGNAVRRALVAILDSKPHPAHLPTLLQLTRDQWSRNSSYHGEDEDYPIARAAVAAIGMLMPLRLESCEYLYDVAIDTSDRRLRDDLFALLARTGDGEIQRRLLELAVNPGQHQVRNAAATALLRAAEHVAADVLTLITTEVLRTRIPSVAVPLAILLASTGELNSVRSTAMALATDSARRALLMPTIWIVAERDPATAADIARVLPPAHAAVTWALRHADTPIDDDLIDDLGDPLCVAEVLKYLRMFTPAIGDPAN